MKNILITGGTGFIGSHLCKRLINEGNHVIALDNNYTGRMDNVKELLENKNFEFIEANVRNSIKIENCKLDEIYNLACPASPPAYQFEHAIDTTMTCVNGAYNVLELALEHNAKVLQASTSEIYGDPTVSPQSESYRGNVNPIGIRACYDEGKRCAESLFFDYYRNKKVRIKVIRIFNTYGPNMDPNDGRVVSNFICQALLGRDITIYGDGSQTRSFCYIDDLIEIMTRVMASDDTKTGPYNTGNPGEFTIKELAELVINATNSSSKIVYKDLPLDDPKQRCPDIASVNKDFSWSPEIKLKEGLLKTIEYFKTQVHKFNIDNK